MPSGSLRLDPQGRRILDAQGRLVPCVGTSQGACCWQSVIAPGGAVGCVETTAEQCDAVYDGEFKGAGTTCPYNAQCPTVSDECPCGIQCWRMVVSPPTPGGVVCTDDINEVGCHLGFAGAYFNSHGLCGGNNYPHFQAFACNTTKITDYYQGPGTSCNPFSDQMSCCGMYPAGVQCELPPLPPDTEYLSGIAGEAEIDVKTCDASETCADPPGPGDPYTFLSRFQAYMAIILQPFDDPPFDARLYAIASFYWNGRWFYEPPCVRNPKYAYISALSSNFYRIKTSWFLNPAQAALRPCCVPFFGREDFPYTAPNGDECVATWQWGAVPVGCGWKDPGSIGPGGGNPGAPPPAPLMGLDLAKTRTGRVWNAVPRSGPVPRGRKLHGMS